MDETEAPADVARDMPPLVSHDAAQETAAADETTPAEEAAPVAAEEPAPAPAPAAPTAPPRVEVRTTLDEWCAARLKAGDHVEILGAFRGAQAKEWKMHDLPSAYEARLKAFASKPAG